MSDRSDLEAALDLQLRLHAGDVARDDTLIDASLSPDDALFARATGEFATITRLTPMGGPRAGTPMPVQLDPSGRLTWRLEAPLGVHESREYRCTIKKARGGERTPTSDGVEIRLAGDHVWFTRSGQLVARYVYLGNWKPYFWPIMVSTGNVVRGASSEHQHQTGLFFAYGGHGGEGTTNVWSDWDEPPYGPCGKIVHQGFDRLEGGPLYGRFVERLIYTRPNGPRLFDEVRDVRIVPLANGILFDITRHAERPNEDGPWPFILSARVADSMRLVDLRQRDERGIPRPIDTPGYLSSGRSLVLETERTATYRTDGPWLDWSGPVGTGTAGLTFIDHPSNGNDGRRMTGAGYGCMSLSRMHPGTEWTTFRYRVYAHDGDAEQANVADRYWDLVEPPLVQVEVNARPPKPDSEH